MNTGIRNFGILLVVPILFRWIGQPESMSGVPIEVSGDVATPGIVVVAPSICEALQAVGRQDCADNQVLNAGDHIQVYGNQVTISLASDPLLMGRRIDLGTVTPAGLASVPGVGLSRATRWLHGRVTPPTHWEQVLAWPGVGEGAVASLQPFVLRLESTTTVDEPTVPLARLVKKGSITRTIDPNRASLEELQRLPGIGPALAQRIVKEREKGQFINAEALLRVKGIGPQKLKKMVPWLAFHGAES